MHFYFYRRNKECESVEFLVKEGVKLAEIYRLLQAQCGDETLSCSKTFEWCKCFQEGRTSVRDDAGLGGCKPTAVVPIYIQRVERLILDIQRVTCRVLAAETALSLGTVKTIVHEVSHHRTGLEVVCKSPPVSRLPSQ